MGVLNLRAFNDRALMVAGWLIALIGFSLPISTAMDNVLLALMLIAFALSGCFWEKLQSVLRNPAVVALAGLFVLLCLGTLYGNAPSTDRLKYLVKYSDLLLVVVMVPLFGDERARRRALTAFAAAMILTLLLSLALSANLLPPAKWLRGTAENATVFKFQITQNLLMAFAAYFFASVAAAESVKWRRLAWYGLALLAFVDVLFLVRGRTGQVALLVLTIYFFARHLRWRGLVIGILATLLAVLAAWYFSSLFRDRLALTTAEYERSKVEAAADESSSVGLRLEWYRNTLRLIAQRPVFGAGTGGFPHAYAGFVTDPQAVKPAHPHNQFLLTATETGVIGLGALLAVFVWLGKSTSRIADPLRRELARGLLMTFVIGCLFNSLLIDHTEGLFFVWMTALAFGGVDRRPGRPQLNPGPGTLLQGTD